MSIAPAEGDEFLSAADILAAIHVYPPSGKKGSEVLKKCKVRQKSRKNGAVWLVQARYFLIGVLLSWPS